MLNNFLNQVDLTNIHRTFQSDTKNAHSNQQPLEDYLKSVTYGNTKQV